MNRALFYLMYRSTVGGLYVRLSRLKQPKYLIPALLGMVYIGFSLTPALMADRAPMERFTTIFTAAGTFFLTLGIAYVWVMDPQKGGLNFSETEAELLLAAPLSRKELVNYYLLRAQPNVLFTAAVFGLFFPMVTRAPSSLLMGLMFFMVLNAYRAYALLVALLWGALEGRWYHWPLRIAPAIPLALAGAMNFPSILNASLAFSDVTLWGITLPGELSLMFSGLPRQVVASGFASHFSEILPGCGVVIAFMAGCYLVSLRLKVRFEEKTLAQARRRVEMVRRRMGNKQMSRPTKERSRTLIPLAPVGPVWRAFAWKGALWLLRGHTFKSILAFLSMNFVAWVSIRIYGASELEMVASMMMVPFCLMATFVTPSMLRTDFRAELEQLEIIKTLPISSRELFAALMFITVGTTVAIQFTLGAMIFGSFLAYNDTGMNPWPLALTAVLVLPTITITSTVIENCLMLWLPAWFIFKKPEMGKGGMEFLGRGVISILARVLVVTVMCLIPGVVGGGVVLLGSTVMGLWSLPLGVGLACILLLIELVLVAGNVAPFYDKLEPDGFEI